jgi:heavy metal translocating P-type ATPase
MTHTATCTDDHTDDHPPLPEGWTSPRTDGAHADPPVLRMPGVRALPEVRWACLATVLFAVAALIRVDGHSRWPSDVLFAACYLAGGWQPARDGLSAFRHRVLDVDLLMVVAALGAAAIGQPLDGGLLIVIFSTSGALEAYATKRTADSVTMLLTLAPERASLLQPDGRECIVDTAQLTVGDIIAIRPGERVGADGEVVFGMSEVDQASVTGEPLPVLRCPGDDVFAGTLNRDGVLHVAVSRAAADSVVGRIVSLVEQASTTKAPAQLFIEKVEQCYSIGVVVTTLGVFGIPFVLGGALQPSLLRAMTYMVVASPCALVLATMPPLLAAIANASRHGVLVKSAVVMEQLGVTTQFAFDKTGTITEGAPRLVDIEPLSISDHAAGEMLALAAAAERSSEHPIGRAIVDAAKSRGLTIPTATEFTAEPGRGIAATVDGHRVRIGSPTHLNLASGIGTEASRIASRLEADGRTAIVVVVDDRPVAVLGLTDQIRQNAAEAVAELATLTGHLPVILTGDNHRAARRLAGEVGISDVRAQLLPEEKVVQVAQLAATPHRVLIVGDGVNDAPALAAAYLGVAMGRHGSDLALQTADAVLVDDDLSALPAVLRLSRQARHAVIQNLVLGSCAIIALVTWDLTGHLPLPLGVLGHEGSTVLIGLNGLRLLRSSAWQPTRRG